jgi:hypothetical protein
MDATNVEPGPARRNRMLVLGGTAAAVILSVLVVLLVQSGEDATPTAQAPAAKAEEVAVGFLEAYGAFDLEAVRTYLADDGTISAFGRHEDPRLILALLEAMGYKQSLHSCEELAGGQSGATLRCAFDFHAIRSDEIGRGPYSGSYFDVTVRNGQVAGVEQVWEIEDFSPQVWEPFARWLSEKHPKDVPNMYLDGSQTNVAVTEQSIRLWERNTQRYVDDVKQNRRRVSRASSVRSG